MRSDTRKSTVLEMLRSAGPQGREVFQMITQGGGNDVRKHISSLRKDGYQITDRWVQVGRSHFKKYFLIENNQNKDTNGEDISWLSFQKAMEESRATFNRFLGGDPIASFDELMDKTFVKKI